MAHEDVNPSMTAAQRALALPEILHEILAEIRGCEGESIVASEVEPAIPGGLGSTTIDESDREDGVELEIYWHGALARCAEVNSLWFQEAIPLLWYDMRTACVGGTTLDFYFDKMTPSRRSIYAQHVEQAEMITSGDRWLRPVYGDFEMIFGDVNFPNLRHLTVRLPIQDGLHALPVFQAPKLQTLTLDPQAEVYPTEYALEPTEWDAVFEQIAREFPKLEEVSVVDRTIILPGAVERYREMLRGTKVEFYGARPWTEVFQTTMNGVRRRLWHPDAGWIQWRPDSEIRDEWSQ